MATLSISLSGSSIVNGTRNYTLTDPMVSRLIAAMKKRFDLTGTDAQVLARWADGLIDVTKQYVLDIEGNEAKRAVTQIEITQ